MGCRDRICPEVRGFDPHELACHLRESADRVFGISPLRKLWRIVTGYYDCPCEGALPCPRFKDITETEL